MKKYEQWAASSLPMSAFLAIGDQVDEPLLDYVAGVLPPIQRPGGWLAMGEPWDSDEDGRTLYLAFQRDIYRGPTAIEDMRAKS